MYDRGCNDTGFFGIKIRIDAVNLMNVRIARFRECRDLARECEVTKVLVEYEAKVTSTVSVVRRRVTYFSKLLFKSDGKKFSLAGVKS